MAIKCFDVVKPIVEEATDQFGSLWKINEDYYNILKQYCEAMDIIAKEHEGEAFDVEIDDVLMTIAIGIECIDFTVEDKNDLYYELVKRAISFGFEHISGDSILVKFTFPSIWEKA